MKKPFVYSALLLCLCALFSACVQLQPAITAAPNIVPSREEELVALHARALEIVSRMDSRALAAQVLMTGIDDSSQISPQNQRRLQGVGVGAIIVFRYNLKGDAATIKTLLSQYSDFFAQQTGVGLAPFIAVDHEGGLIQRFGPPFIQMPAPAVYWELAQKQGWEAALASIEEASYQSGRQIHEVGISLNLAPVAETLTPANKSFLGDRLFGPDAMFNEKACAAFIRGMERAGIMCTLKHFPGHSREDPHKAVSTLHASREELDEAIMPFKALIEAERLGELAPVALMVSHVKVAAIDPEHNASLSKAVIEDWLRAELGYTGIVVGDDYAMGAVKAAGKSTEETVIEALNAGIDLVLVWPNNVIAVHRAIIEALNDGTLSRQRLQEAASRIVFEKLRLNFTFLPSS
ncbi:glycoside hydrolase family 3 N-terminal domain-containing protein [Breznakiellaceae bacterium SP9]